MKTFIVYIIGIIVGTHIGIMIEKNFGGSNDESQESDI